ncbi:MAG: alkaline phosphatase D family protein [Polyangiaceae bacterium]|nr:alkaline phosphatase D family protein [Polyangiaceae bacterium]
MHKRRDFLRITVVTLGAAVLDGCSSDAAPAPTTPAELEDGSEFFPQSVASGDPKPKSAIIWTRVEDKERAGWDLDVYVEVALDDKFTKLLTINGSERLHLLAESEYDNCVKVRFIGEAGKTYYYRFIYEKEGRLFKSRTGRVKTAPEETADVKVRFAFVSCQDFIGRYYNVLWALAKEELDFFVHLGDYIYETTGDPGFQTPDASRKIAFRDAAGSLALETSKGEVFFAARSVSNYRDLYRAYRSDPALQALHESCAMVATWDDHEFSDDCWGENGTYSDGRLNEADVARRQAASQAWFEYMPVDYPDAENFRYDAAKAFPEDIRIYRDLKFGKNVHLVLTDLRMFRPDHLIAEDAFPGAVAFDQAALMALPGGLPPDGVATAYVDIDDPNMALYKGLLQQVAMASAYPVEKITGNVSVNYINAVVAQINATMPPMPVPELMLPPDPPPPRGISYFDLNKASFHSSIGSRYFVHKDSFDVYAGLKKADQNILGETQETWFLDTITKSTSTWKIWASSFVLSPTQIDLTMQMGVPALFLRRFYMNLDGWDGFPAKRDELIGKLAPVGNVVAISGDLHTFLAGTPYAGTDKTKNIVEFTCGAVSSSPYRQILVSQIKNDPVLSTVPAAPLLAANIDALMLDKTVKPNPHLGHASSNSHGFCIAEVDGAEIVVAMHSVGSVEVTQNYTGKTDDFFMKVQVDSFKTTAGKKDLQKQIDGAWKRWDTTLLDWV